MKVQSENYKGIEFIRISSLPEEQKLKIKGNFSSQRIIKILKEKELLSDCIQYCHYLDWYSKNYPTIQNKQAASSVSKGRILQPA